MARSVLFDVMQNHPFWIFDVFTANSPSLPVFNPLWGFSTCTMPTWAAQVMDIREGNRQYPRKVYRSGSYEPITLSRGVRFFDNDFYRWMMSSSEGNPAYFSDILLGLDVGGPTPRRSLILVHFLAHLPIPAGADITRQANATAASIAGSAAVVALESAAALLQPFSPAFETVRLPGRMWLLTGCLPTRYKAGTDFDASSGDVSIQELDIEAEGIEQISLVDVPLPAPA